MHCLIKIHTFRSKYTLFDRNTHFSVEIHTFDRNTHFSVEIHTFDRNAHFLVEIHTFRSKYTLFGRNTHFSVEIHTFWSKYTLLIEIHTFRSKYTLYVRNAHFFITPSPMRENTKITISPNFKCHSPKKFEGKNVMSIRTAEFDDCWWIILKIPLEKQLLLLLLFCVQKKNKFQIYLNNFSWTTSS